MEQRPSDSTERPEEVVPPAAAGDGDLLPVAQAQAILEQMARLTGSAGSKPRPLSQPLSAGPWRVDLRYRALIEKIPAVTFVAALDDAVQELYVSPQIQALLGFSQEEWLDNPFLWYEQLHPEDRDRWASEFARTCATGATFRSDYRLLARDGRVVWVHGECQVVQDEEGRPQFLQGIAFDITASKQAEEVLRRSHEELEAQVRQRTEELHAAKEAAESASRAKDRFLAVLSHELRTPLTPVLASVEELARHPGLPAEVAASLEMIRRNVEMEARLIDDLLDLTRISRGKIELRLQTLDAHASLRHALEVWQREIEARRIEVTLHLWAARHHVRADPIRLQQVFWNLIGNAVKFTPEGGRVGLHSSNEPDGRLTIRVSDTGIGIHPEMLPRLFNAFEQGERTVTRRYGGLGLGLAISKALVEMHQGTLAAVSEGTGRGATFTLSMGTARESGVAAPAEPAAPERETRRAMKILLVEDHVDTLRAMARLLRAERYTVSTAGSVQEGLRAAEAGGFDLLISDLGLPDGSGHDLMRELKSRHPIRGIALSGFGMDEDVRRSREAGFDRHLTKPVSLDVLQAAIRQVAG